MKLSIFVVNLCIIVAVLFKIDIYQYLKFSFVYLMLAMSSEYQEIFERSFECL